MTQSGEKYCTTFYDKSMKPVRVIKMFLNETYCNFCISKYLYDAFCQCFSILLYNMLSGRPGTE
jgi:hypothetical protein